MIAPSDKHPPSISLAVFLALGLLPLVITFFPRVFAFLPQAIAGAGILAIWMRTRQKIPLNRSYAYGVLILGGLWLASCFWSIDFAGSFKKIPATYPVVLFGIFIPSLIPFLSINAFRSYLWVFPLSLALGAAYLAAELSLNLPLYRMAHGMRMDENLSSAVLNRAIIAISLSVFLAVPMMRYWDAPRKQKIPLLSFLILSVAMMLILTQSQSAQLCVLIGVLIYPFYPVRWRVSYYIALGGIVLLTLISPWLSIWMYGALASDVGSFSWLKHGYAANRMEIWDFVSREALKSPLYGHGLEATKLKGDFDFTPVYQTQKSILHPHNFAIQLWMEFGLIGVVLSAVFFGFILRAISMLPPVSARASIVVFITTLSVAAMTYGLWQSWWLGLLLYLYAMALILVRLEREKSV